jgi:hypothetical protein
MWRSDLPGFLLSAGSNERALIALCRGFTRYGIDFGLIGRGPDDLLLRSKYAGHFLGMGSRDTLSVADILWSVQKARRRYGRRNWVICPTSEHMNRHLLEKRDVLLAEGVELALCDGELYRKLSDKRSFRAYCLGAGLDVPPLLQADPHSAPLPFVAKPNENINAEGRILYPYIVRTEADRKRFLRDRDWEQFHLERFVRGESWYILYYIDGCGGLRSGAQRNLLQQGQGKSVVLARTEKYPDVGLVHHLALRLRVDRYRGFIMVEVRRDHTNAVMIEAIPRCWGPFQLTLDAKMGLFEAFLNDYGYDIDLIAPTEDGVLYLWKEGLWRALRDGMGVALHAPLTSIASALSIGWTSDIYARHDSYAGYSRSDAR